ncbi:uracil-DNA glycosylase-like protein [Irpex rosettiformis]|uniref:Uracil-DNA glycosylase-like protein n=1 Tax=Irpex rosettiformis TaxID=378272 RepID=A0ACB8U670_9APHY|nr:uracil-DNA glycosylase-like protein [Irpex rosettiformis]
MSSRKSARIRLPSAKLRSSPPAGTSLLTSKKTDASAASSKYLESRATVKDEQREDALDTGELRVQIDSETTTTTTTSSRKRKRTLPSTVAKLESKEDVDVKPLLRAPGTKRVKTETEILSAKYAPPEKYAHLQNLTDYLVEGLDVVFCGINPGCRSAEVGHHFAHPTNHFWRCLHQSGFTERQLAPSEDVSLPEMYNLGMTDLVERPSSEQAELSKADMLTGVPTLLAKVRKYKPRVVCFVGKQIGELFCKEATRLTTEDSIPEEPPVGTIMDDSQSKGKAPGRRQGKNSKTFQWGMQEFKVVHHEARITGGVDGDDKALLAKETHFFIMPSTSARVAGYQLADKVRIMKDLFECSQRLKATDYDIAPKFLCDEVIDASVAALTANVEVEDMDILKVEMA